jgi:N-methylhydantoinase B
MVFDERGRLIAQASSGPPSFTGTLPYTLKHLLNKFPANSLVEGDVLATNDPWMGTGHTFDICVVKPVFKSGKLIAYTGAVSNLPDVGGVGFTALAKEVFEEGLRILPIKIVKAGKLNEELFEIIHANVRVPIQTIGDIKSDITTVDVLERKLLEFMREYGFENISELSDALISRSEKAMRQEISKIPTGIYESELMVEGVQTDHKIKCKVVVKGDELEVNYDGTSGQSDYAINSPLTYTRAYTNYAIKCSILPFVPNNQGNFNPLTVTAPERTILNPLFPAAVNARHRTGWFAALAVWGALAKVVPDRVVAESGMSGTIFFSGFDSQGKPFSVPGPCFSGGTGARANLDGIPATGIPTIISNQSVEVVESLSPLIVESWRIIPDSGGAGKFRGGPGTSCTMRNLSEKAITVSFVCNKFRYPARGYLGGKDGSLRKVFMDDKEVNALGTYSLPSYHTVKVDDAGGGGFYDPAERDTKLLLDDIENGYVTRNAAREIYGKSL